MGSRAIRARMKALYLLEQNDNQFNIKPFDKTKVDAMTTYRENYLKIREKLVEKYLERRAHLAPLTDREEKFLFTYETKHKEYVKELSTLEDVPIYWTAEALRKRNLRCKELNINDISSSPSPPAVTQQTSSTSQTGVTPSELPQQKTATAATESSTTFLDSVRYMWKRKQNTFPSIHKL